MKGLGDAPRFLLCNFAQGREYWEVKFAGYSGDITEDMPDGMKPAFELAMPAMFAEQCDNADVIYCHGGDDDLFRYWMQRYSLPELFEGKVVATNSASSYMLSAYCWTADWRACDEGFGILPIKFIGHYMADLSDDPRGSIDWQRAYDDLAAYGDTSLPVHALREGEYIVIEK